MTEPTIQLRPVRLGKMLCWYATITSDGHAYLA